MSNSNNQVNRAILPIIAQRSQHNKTINNRNLVTTFDKTKKWAIPNSITSRLKDNRKKKRSSVSNQLRTPWKSRAKLEAAMVRRNSKSAEIISSIWPSKIIICQPWIILKIVASTQSSSSNNQGTRTFLRASLRPRQIISRKGLMAQIKNSEEVVSSKPEEYKIRHKLELLFLINIARHNKSSKTLKKSWLITSFIQTKALMKSRTNLYNQDISKKLPLCKPLSSNNRTLIWEAHPRRWKITQVSMLVGSLDKLFKPKILILPKLWVRWQMWIPRRNDQGLVWITRSKVYREATKILANRVLSRRSSRTSIRHLGLN